MINNRHLKNDAIAAARIKQIITKEKMRAKYIHRSFHGVDFLMPFLYVRLHLGSVPRRPTSPQVPYVSLPIYFWIVFRTSIVSTHLNYEDQVRRLPIWNFSVALLLWYF